MPLREWSRSARHPMALFLAVTLIPGTVLSWLGWRLLRADQALESRRIQARLETAAEAISAALDRRLVEYEERLSTLAAGPDHQAKTSCLSPKPHDGLESALGRALLWRFRSAAHNQRFRAIPLVAADECQRALALGQWFPDARLLEQRGSTTRWSAGNVRASSTQVPA